MEKMRNANRKSIRLYNNEMETSLIKETFEFNIFFFWKYCVKKVFSVFLFKKSKKSEIGKRVSVRSSQLSPLYSSSKSGGEKEERKREGEVGKRGKRVKSEKELYLMKWEEEKGETDLVKMEALSVENIVENLKERYLSGKIYTYCGDILLALNPYSPLPCYQVSVIKQYTSAPLGELPPHLFAISDNAYRVIKKEKRSVSLVISGLFQVPVNGPFFPSNI